jgi:hypothetical protein
VPATARGICLPPAYDGGQRLHLAPSPDTYWLGTALRQHELCWRGGPADERRVLLLGNSSVFGHGLPPERTAARLASRELERRGVNAHVFNLAWVASYQLKDALILNEALRYDPDAIVWTVSPMDLKHRAPVVNEVLSEFFEENADELGRFADERPPGLEELAERYQKAVPGDAFGRPWHRLRQLGRFTRSAVRQYGAALAAALAPVAHAAPARVWKGQHLGGDYDCAAVQREWKEQFTGWQEWNALAWLERLQKQRGIPVLVVAWPVASALRWGCYNQFYPMEFPPGVASWLADETSRRGLAYLDLHRVVPPKEFVDWTHIGPAANVRVAGRLAPAVARLLAGPGAAPDPAPGSAPGGNQEVEHVPEHERD